MKSFLSWMLRLASIALIACGLEIGATTPVEAEEKNSTDDNHHESRKTTFDGKKIRSESDQSIAADSSEAMREGKKGFITVTGFGFGGAGILRGGINGGVFLNPNLILAAGYQPSDNLWASSRVPESAYSYVSKENSLSVYAEKFWANSFYTNLGLAHNSYDFRFDQSEGDIGSIRQTRSQQKFEAQHLIFSIGNQWQWSYFTLGCDWLGSSYVLHHKILSNKKIDSTTQEPMNPNAIEIGKDIRVLKVYAGYTF